MQTSEEAPESKFVIVSRASVLASRRKTLAESVAAFVADPDSVALASELTAKKAPVCIHDRLYCLAWCGVMRVRPAHAFVWRVIPRERRHEQFAAWRARCEERIAAEEASGPLDEVFSTYERHPQAKPPIEVAAPDLLAIGRALRERALRVVHASEKTHGWHLLIERPERRDLLSLGWNLTATWRGRHGRTTHTVDDITILRQIVGGAIGPEYLQEEGAAQLECEMCHSHKQKAVYRVTWIDYDCTRCAVQRNPDCGCRVFDSCADCIVRFQTRGDKIALRLLMGETKFSWCWAFYNTDVFPVREIFDSDLDADPEGA